MHKIFTKVTADLSMIDVIGQYHLAVTLRGPLSKGLPLIKALSTYLGHSLHLSGSLAFNRSKVRRSNVKVMC